MARPFYVEHAVPVASTFTVLGVVGMALGIIDFTNKEIFDIGGWGYYLIGLAFVSILVGILMFYGYIKKIRHFKKLMTVKSKKEMIGIMDDLGYTAWRLPLKYDKLVADKKKEFDIK
jgi:membrane-bound ClpP family serine protease